MNLGRVVAYYPGLKKVTGSTTASILLCQFLYWTDKSTDNGWIWKTAEELEEETGLTYNEQRTARAILVSKGVLEEENKRLDHTMRFRVIQDVLNDLWEEEAGKKSTPVVEKEEQPKEDKKEEPVVPVEEEKPAPKKPAPKEKKKDLVDAYLYFSQSEAMKKVEHLDKIKEKLSINLRINPDGKKWQDFIEFIYKRETKNSEKVELFIKWAIDKGFDPIYWTPEKMRTVWPQAFVVDESKTYSDNFVKSTKKKEEKKEEEFVPMPRGMGINRDQ